MKTIKADQNLPVLDSSYLIQRLDRPRGNTPPTNPFSFGGGYVNGGLSEELLKLLNGVCIFDYMGAAEFEFGEVPKAFNTLAEIRKAKNLALWPVAIGAHEPRTPSQGAIPQDHWDWDNSLRGEQVYVLGDERYRNELDHRICEFAQFDQAMAESKWTTGEKKFYQSLKEMSFFSRALKARMGDARAAEYCHTAGWLELNNGYMFFIDTNMALVFADIYDVPEEQRYCKLKKTETGEKE